MCRLLIAASLLCPSLSMAADDNLTACALFADDLGRLQCYEAVIGHAGKPPETLFVFPPRPPVVPPPPTPAEICRNAYDLAKAIMTIRQSGQPMPDAMQAAAGSREVAAMVAEAYRQPLGAAAGIRQSQIDQFGNDYYGRCISAQN